MIHVVMTLFVVALFYVLTPGVFLSIPKGKSLKMKALLHGLVFALVFHFTHKIVENYFYGDYHEGFFAAKPDTPAQAAAKAKAQAAAQARAQAQAAAKAKAQAAAEARAQAQAKAQAAAKARAQAAADARAAAAAKAKKR